MLFPGLFLARGHNLEVIIFIFAVTATFAQISAPKDEFAAVAANDVRTPTTLLALLRKVVFRHISARVGRSIVLHGILAALCSTPFNVNCRPRNAGWLTGIAITS